MKKIVYTLLILGIFAFTPIDSSNAVQFESTIYSPACCKICKKGKACGDSCISKDYQCHKPKGCACNG